jgi:hypothetical protein
MPVSMRPPARALALIVTALLAACGGGGDEDSPPQASGLVPAAPVLGATLAADATTLRPFAPGATWTYLGNTNPQHTNTVTHTATATGVRETHSNLFAAGPAEQQLAVLNGQVVHSEPADVDGDGVVDITNPVELRSPVRVGDQIVFFDRRLVGVIADADGDGRAESLDFAVYSQVIGEEPVNLGGSLPDGTAIRVDQITKGRLVLSGGGPEQPVITVIQSSWYDSTHGVVRRRLEQPGVAAPVIETLVSVTGL